MDKLYEENSDLRSLLIARDEDIRALKQERAAMIQRLSDALTSIRKLVNQREDLIEDMTVEIIRNIVDAAIGKENL